MSVLDIQSEIGHVSPKPPTDGRPLLGGRYELVSALGKGGMGTVWRAVQHPLDREVAVKVLRRDGLSVDESRRALRRFFKEARAIASLHHPHVIPLYDFGESDRGDFYLVMELLPGKALSEVIHREGPMGLTRAAWILDQVLDALQEAHRNQIVHRDLKPENIQIGRRGDRTDFVPVLDFGIARATDLEGRESPTKTTIEVCGTPAYMSPEQILGTVVDPRSDLYACGVLLFEMLTGRVPFEAEQTVDIYLGHLKREPPALAEFVPELASHPGLQELMDRFLAKDASERMPDAKSARLALRSVAGMPSAGPERVAKRTTSPGVGHSMSLELVAAVEPSRAPGLDALIEQWAMDIAQQGGTVRERRPGMLVATFPQAETSTPAIRAALAMKKRTKERRQELLRPLFIRVGIHQQPSIAVRLCDEAPRGGVVVGAELVDRDVQRALPTRVRFEPLGEMRIRGHRGPVRMLQLLSGR